MRIRISAPTSPAEALQESKKCKHAWENGKAMTHGRVLLSRKAGAGEPAVIGQRGGGEQGLESVGGSRNTGSVSNESLNFVLE